MENFSKESIFWLIISLFILSIGISLRIFLSLNGYIDIIDYINKNFLQ